MSKILILGGAGMIGQKLAQRIAAGLIHMDVTELVLYDIVDANLQRPHSSQASFASR